MQIIITINTDGAAFGDSDETTAAEIVSILSELRDKLQRGTLAQTAEHPIRDENGNTCGAFTIKE